MAANASGWGRGLASIGDKQAGLASRIRVDAEEAGSRLDRLLLRRLGGSARPLVMRLIRRGNVRVNGRRARPELRLAAGDEIFLPASLRQPAGTRAPSPVPLQGSRAAPMPPVLYEDADLLVINKPPGVVVHGGSGHAHGLIELLRESLGEPELRLAHRLDRDTSGCLLLARRLSVLRALTAAFRDRAAHKTYLAWVAGWPEPPAGRLRGRLLKGRLRGGERVVVTGEGGKAAVTDYQTCIRADLATGQPGEMDAWRAALLALTPESGRTHQLRVQLQAAGHAILGDGKYGSRDDNRRFRALGGRGLALHAWRLRIAHPADGRLLDVRAPWPQWWSDVGMKLVSPDGGFWLEEEKPLQ